MDRVDMRTGRLTRISRRVCRNNAPGIGHREMDAPPIREGVPPRIRDVRDALDGWSINLAIEGGTGKFGGNLSFNLNADGLDGRLGFGPGIGLGGTLTVEKSLLSYGDTSGFTSQTSVSGGKVFGAEGSLTKGASGMDLSIGFGVGVGAGASQTWGSDWNLYEF